MSARSPSLLRWPNESGSPRLLLGVTTYNRAAYLERFVSSYMDTRSTEFDWVLIIADDGSTDSTREFLEKLEVPDTTVVKIFNRAAGIAGQTNSILMAADAIEHDVGIKCDDDVYFTRPGWDHGYFNTVRSSGMDHLVYHNEEWKTADVRVDRIQLRARSTLTNAMGCLWTFTPKVLEKVGFFDENEFPLRGHSHLDYTARAARAGFNDSENLWDWSGSEDSVAMWTREDYAGTIDWDSQEVKSVLTPEERQRRMGLVLDPDREYVEFDPSPLRPLPRFTCSRPDRRLLVSLVQRGLSPRSFLEPALYDEAFILNLPHHIDRWTRTAGQLAQVGIDFRRAPTVNGYSDSERTDWEEYARHGSATLDEVTLRRKLIQSPGAWGYLSSMIAVLNEARRCRLDRLMVFDDDILLAKEFDKEAPLFVGALPDGWTLAYLGASYQSFAGVTQVAEGVVDPGTTVNGSFAIALDSEVFDLVEADASRREWPFDAGALREVRRQRPGSVFAARPELVIADVTSSSIRNHRNQQRFAQQMGWDLDRHKERHALPPCVGLIVFADDAVRLRETLRSIRGQHHANFRALVVCPNAQDDVIAMASRCATDDPRVHVGTAGVKDPVTAFAAASRLMGDFPVACHVAGDILLPSHLTTLVGLLEGGLASIPSAILLPSDAWTPGRLGTHEDEIVTELLETYGAAQSPSRVLRSVQHRAERGDLPAYDDETLGGFLERSSVSTKPTLLVRFTEDFAVPEIDPAAAFHLHPGRSAPITLLGDPTLQ